MEINEDLKTVATIEEKIEWYFNKNRIPGCFYIKEVKSYEILQAWFLEFYPIWRSMFINLPTDQDRKDFTRKLEDRLKVILSVQEKDSCRDLILEDFIPEVKKMKPLESPASFALMVYVCQEVGVMEQFKYPKGGKKKWLIEYGEKKGYNGIGFYNSYSAITSHKGKPFKSENDRWNYTKSNAEEVLEFLDPKSKAHNFLITISNPHFE